MPRGYKNNKTDTDTNSTDSDTNSTGNYTNISSIDIDTNKYGSTSGLSTKMWGPHAWNFLFCCVMGGYPPHLDMSNREHRAIRTHFINMFQSLCFTMPCIFCRESYTGFIQDLPIKKYTNTRINMMRWLYKLRDKVNQKLIAQERKCYNDEKKILKQRYHDGLITRSEYYQTLEKTKADTLVTTSSPPFREVLDKYERIRAVCSRKAKTCSLPKSNVSNEMR